TVNAPGTYTLTVTSLANGCSATATTVLAANTAAPTASAGPNITLPCEPPGASLQGGSNTPGALFNWSTTNGHFITGINTPAPLVDAAGVYVLTVTDPANGCTASASVTVQAPSADFPLPGTTAPDCASGLGSIVFSGGAASQGPFLYSIDGGLTFKPDSLFLLQLPGSYNTVVQDAGGCERQQTVLLPAVKTVTVNLPATAVVQAGGNLILAASVNLPASEIASISWTPVAGLSCSDCLNPVATPTNDVVYSVTVTSVGGCTGSASVVLTVEQESGVYVPNSFSPDLDGRNDLFQIQTARLVNRFEMQIFDRWGNHLFTGTDLNGGWDGSARGKQMPPGVYTYFIRLEVLDGQGQPEELILSGDVLLK
ncbi:MAG: gliding motility-associated C-terminal domain-containing protein, partial [Saprospiraceae bacterium]|nr:gliding motility-associated C-terminal domain-containing protein [Saprospiraceae bacterium]